MEGMVMEGKNDLNFKTVQIHWIETFVMCLLDSTLQLPVAV